MRKRMTEVFVVCLCFAAMWVTAMSGNQAAPQPRAAQGAGFHGFACDVSGKPVTDAEVTINLTINKRTDPDGTFFVSEKEIQGRRISLLVFVNGTVDGKQYRCAHLADYATGTENATFILRDSASIIGRIVTPDGKPIEGAAVSALIDVGGLTCHGTHPVGKPVRTDSDGQFTIPDMYPDAKYMLRIYAPGRERKMTDWIHVGSTPIGRPVEIRLRDAPGAIAGRVVDERGKPVAQAVVILGHPCIPDAQSTTDADGKFRITELIPGEEVTLCFYGKSQEVKVGTEDLVLVAPERAR